MRNILAGIAAAVVVAVVAYFTLDMAQKSSAERFTAPGVSFEG